jgi:cytochrome P450
VPRPGTILGLGAVRRMHAMVAEAIAAHRPPAPGAASDLLDHMLAAEDPTTGRRVGPENLLYNMQFFIVAGHETTALALAWALMLLAHDETAPPTSPRALHRAGAPGGDAPLSAGGAARPQRA